MVSKTRENHFQSALDNLKTAKGLAHELCRIVREQCFTDFEAWLAQAQASGLTELKGFAVGLLQDKTAVTAALSSEWSNEQVEGQVNRLKMIKRQMYGRANFITRSCFAALNAHLKGLK